MRATSRVARDNAMHRRGFSELESELEGRNRQETEAWHLARTIDQTKWVSQSRYWAATFSQLGLSETNLTDPDDFLVFPCLSKRAYKTDMTRSPPYGGFLCRPLGEIEQQGAHLFRTTGTTGRQIPIIKTKLEIDAFARCGARNLLIAGARPGDYVLMTFPCTMWTGAWGYYHGAALVGATIIPAGAPLPTGMRIELLTEYCPRIIVCTPSYALAFAEAVKSAGRNPAEAGVEIILVGGEPFSAARRRRIEQAWGAPGGVRNFSGISEVAAVYLGAECEAQQGMHLYEDMVRCDVLVPDRTEWASSDVGGELVVTSLVETALALNYRFRTGDFVYFSDEPCRCGRTSRRLLSIETRLDDMRKIRGVNVWASAVEELLHAVDGVGDEFELLLEQIEHLDEVTVRVEARREVPADQYTALAATAQGVLKARIGLRLPVEVVSPDTLPRYELKAKRWVDHRKDG